MGKKPIHVERDEAGFLVNRVALASLIEAISLVERGVATIEEVDKAMKLGLGHRKGPFETCDLVGLDIVLSVCWSIYRDTRDAKFFPPLLLRRLVAAGHLGRKTGRGFYPYPSRRRIFKIYEV